MSISGDFAVYATKKGALPVSVETRPKGKKVTIVQNVKGEAAMLLAALQAQLGVGGTVRNAAGDPAGTRRIELQGNQVERLNKALLAMDCLKGVAKSKEDTKADKAVTNVERDCAYDGVLEGATARRKPRHQARDTAPQFDWSLRKAPCFHWHGPWIYCRGYCEIDPRTVTFDDVWEESLCPVRQAAPQPGATGAKRPAPTRAEIDEALKGSGMLSEIGEDILDYSRSKSRKVLGGVYYGEDIRDPRAKPAKAVNNSWSVPTQQLESKPAPHKVRAPYPSWSPAAAAWQQPQPPPQAPDPALWADGPDPGSASGRLAAGKFDAQVGPTKKARKQPAPAPTSSAEGWLDEEPERGAPPPPSLCDWLDLGPKSKGKADSRVDEGFELVEDPQVWSDVSVLQVYWGAAVEEWLDAASLRNILARVHVVEAEIGEQQGRIVCANAPAAEEATRALSGFGISTVPADVVDLRDGACSPEPEEDQWEALPAEASDVQEMSPKRDHVPGQVTGFEESDVTALVASLNLEPQTLSRFVTFYGELEHEHNVEQRFMQALEQALNAEMPAFVAAVARDERQLGSAALAEKEQERLAAAKAHDDSQAERERLEMEAEQQHLRRQAEQRREQLEAEKRAQQLQEQEEQRQSYERLLQAQQDQDQDQERRSLEAAQEIHLAEQRKAQHEELFAQRQRERQLQEQKQQEKALRELRRQEEAQRRACDEALREERARLERERELREQQLVDEGLQALPTKQKWEQGVASGLQPRNRAGGLRAAKTVSAARALAARATQVVPRESSLEEWVAGQVRARRLAISPDVLVSLLLVAQDEAAFARDLRGVIGDGCGQGFAKACWRERERAPGGAQAGAGGADSVEAYVAQFLQEQGSEDQQLLEYVTSMLAADDQDGLLSLLPGMFPQLDDADVLRFLSEAP